MRNYFNYFTEIEERFQQRRGALLLLSTIDWALIETWREAGIPLEAVLRGIDAAFDKYESRQRKARMQRINGLAWCAQAVMESAEEMREAATGTAAKTEKETPEGFEHDRVAAHLEAAAAALETSKASHEACAATATRLRELAEDIRQDTEGKRDLESLERTLTVLEDKLYGAIKIAAPEKLLTDLKEHADRELAPYRSRMVAAQLQQVKDQFERKQLLVYYDLPRLSLFYMSQQ
ncbi:MAG: hypothetical protein KGN79_02920 [Acidobacteriota bacterium]|nr:hypothetical protein [Acidobacteriota bacterium]